MTDTSPAEQPDALDELDAMRLMVQALVPLDEAAAQRAVRWTADFAGVALTGAPGPAVETPDPETFMAMAVEWACGVLAMLDPKEVEQSCLDALGFGDGPSLAEAQLREIARRFQIAAGTREAAELWRST